MIDHSRPRYSTSQMGGLWDPDPQGTAQRAIPTQFGAMIGTSSKPSLYPIRAD